MNRQLKSARDLQNEAEKFSHYAGDGMVLFQDDQDDLMHFAGSATNFAQALQNLRPYEINLTNNGAAACTALLCAGLIRAAAGLIKTGAFTDINGLAGLSGQSNSSGSIELFTAYIDKKPTLISGVKLTSSNINQLSSAMIIKSESPFEGKGEKVITTGAYQSENAQNEKILTIQEAFYMDDETRITYTVLPGASVNIMFFIGASVNQAKGLRKKAAKAKSQLLGQ
jgi:hypothetical protein